jgi:hypothetical protein
LLSAVHHPCSEGAANCDLHAAAGGRWAAAASSYLSSSSWAGRNESPPVHSSGCVQQPWPPPSHGVCPPPSFTPRWRLYTGRAFDSILAQQYMPLMVSLGCLCCSTGGQESTLALMFQLLCALWQRHAGVAKVTQPFICDALCTQPAPRPVGCVLLLLCSAAAPAATLRQLCQKSLCC